MDSAASASFKIISGTPTAEELAALVGTLRALGRRATEPAAPAPESAWARSARPGAGAVLARGHDAWRLSALPR